MLEAMRIILEHWQQGNAFATLPDETRSKVGPETLAGPEQAAGCSGHSAEPLPARSLLADDRAALAFGSTDIVSGRGHRCRSPRGEADGADRRPAAGLDPDPWLRR